MRLQLAYTLRALGRQRLYCAMVLVTMALGLGANAVLAAIGDALYLQPLAYVHGERLALVDATWGSPPTAVDDHGRPVVKAFAAVGGYRTGEGTVQVAGEPVRIRLTAVTPSFFEVFKDAPKRGLTFAGTGTRARHGVVVAERLAGLLGPQGAQSIVIDGKRMDVLGVMPERFEFPGRADAWILADDVDFAFYRGARFLKSVALLAPGTTAAVARQALRAHQAPGRVDDDPDDDVVPLRESLHHGLADKLLLCEWLAALLLGVSWVAVLHSQVLRLTGRTTEFATRLALGARPRQLVSLVWLESMLLYGGGALLAIGVAALSSPYVTRLLPERLAQSIRVAVSPATVAATLGLALACAVVAGAITAWKIHRLAKGMALASTRRTVESQSMAPGGASFALVAVQIGLTTAAVVCTLLLWRSFGNVLRTEAGLVPAGLVSFRIELPLALGERGRKVVPQIEAALRDTPETSAVGTTSHLPVRDVGGFLVPVRAADGSSGAGWPVHFRAVSAGYFETVGTRVLQGRALSPADRQGPPSVVVNERLARMLWPDGRAVGRLVAMPFDRENPNAEIVGVVADVKHFGLTEDTEPEVYSTVERGHFPVMTVVVRTDAPLDRVRTRARAVVARVAPGVAAYDFATVAEVMAASYRERQVQSVVALLFAVIGVAVASTTIFAVIGLLLRSRSREVAIRMALGASRRVVLTGMARGAGLAASIGLAGGLVLAWSAGTYLQSMLYQLDGRDPWSFAMAGGLVVVCAAGASVEATRRCTREDALADLR